MIINDAVYGTFEINEPVIIDIINSNIFQRLKNISSAGFYPAYKNLSSKYTNRYNHSIGVFCLLRKYNASLEEQIAGLIHDVNHTAFSHTIDYVIGTLDDQKYQTKQDMNFDDFIKQSEISVILKKYNFDIDTILNDKNWTLKENKIPNICADRIDYSLRDGFVVYKMLTKDEVDKILNSLIVYNNSFVFNNYDIAYFFTNFFWNIDSQHYSGLKSAIMFSISAKLFKLAIQKKYISINEFYNNDDIYIINKINDISKKDNDIKQILDLLYLPVEKYENNLSSYIEHTFCKNRRIDPFFLKDGILYKVSDINKDYKDKLYSLKPYSEYFINVKE